MSINRIPTRGLERNLIIDLAPGSISSPSLRINHTTGEPWDHNVDTGIYSPGLNAIGITLGNFKSVVFRKTAGDKVVVTIFDGLKSSSNFISSLDELGLTVFGDIALHGDLYARGNVKCFNLEIYNPQTLSVTYPVIHFDNLSQMQNFNNPIDGQIYYLKGISTLNDLYSGFYVWSSTNNNPPDSNYTFIQNNNFSTGRYIRLEQNKYITDSIVVGSNTNFSVNLNNINLKNNVVVDNTGINVVNNSLSIINNSTINLQSSVFSSTNFSVTNSFRCRDNKFGLCRIVNDSDIDAYINNSEDRENVLSLSTLDKFLLKKQEQEEASINETLNIYVDNNFYTSSLLDRGYSGAWATVNGMINAGLWTSSTPVTWSNFVSRPTSHPNRDYAKIITYDDFRNNLLNDSVEERFNLNNRDHPKFRVFSSIRDAARYCNFLYKNNYNVTVVINIAPGIYPCENETFNTNVIINGYNMYAMQFNNLSPLWKISPIVNNSSYDPATAYGSDRLLNGSTGFSTGHTIRGYEIRTFEYSPVFYQENHNQSSYSSVVSNYSNEWNPKHTTILCYRNAPSSPYPQNNDLVFNDSMLIFNGGSSQIRRVVFQSPQETLRIRNKNINTDIFIATSSGARFIRKRFDSSQFDTSPSTITNLTTLAPTTSYMSSASKSLWEIDTIDYIYRFLISSVKSSSSTMWDFNCTFIRANNCTLTVTRCVFGSNWSSIRKTAPSGGQSHVNFETRYEVNQGDIIKSSIIHLNNSKLNFGSLLLRGVEYSTFNNSYTSLTSGAISCDCFIKAEKNSDVFFVNLGGDMTPNINITDIFGRTSIYNETYTLSSSGSQSGFIKYVFQTCSDSLSSTHENLLNGNFSNTLTNNRNIWRFVGACYGYFIFCDRINLSFASNDAINQIDPISRFCHGTFGTPLEVATDPSGNWRWRKTMFLYSTNRLEPMNIISPSSITTSTYTGYDIVVNIGATLFNTPMNTLFSITDGEAFVQQILLLSCAGYSRASNRNTFSGTLTLNDSSGSSLLSPFRTTGNNSNEFVRSITLSGNTYPSKTALGIYLTLNLYLLYHQNGIWIGAKRWRPQATINTSVTSDTKTLFHYIAYSLTTETFPPLNYFNDKLDNVYISSNTRKLLL